LWNWVLLRSGLQFRISGSTVLCCLTPLGPVATLAGSLLLLLNDQDSLLADLAD
jgi:hypothetical protein